MGVILTISSALCALERQQRLKFETGCTCRPVDRRPPAAIDGTALRMGSLEQVASRRADPAEGGPVPLADLLPPPRGGASGALGRPEGRPVAQAPTSSRRPRNWSKSLIRVRASSSRDSSSVDSDSCSPCLAARAISGLARGRKRRGRSVVAAAVSVGFGLGRRWGRVRGEARMS